ncbi:MAG: hypothetical protein ACO3F3_15930 [Gemmataceae bacterium]
MIKFGSLNEVKIRHIHNDEPAVMQVVFLNDGICVKITDSQNKLIQESAFSAVQVSLLRQIFPFCEPFH